MSSSVATIATVQRRVGQMLPNLSKAEAEALGLLSYGILLFNGCGLTRLSKGLAKLEQVPAGRLRQRLREFSYEAEAKRGNKRREVKVEACFADLLRSVLRGWEGKKELALAMDASTLGERFTVLSISVMYRGCGIPVAWKIIAAMGSVRMASALGRVARNVGSSGPARLEGDPDGRPGPVCSLALSGHPASGMAPDAAGERGLEFSGVERRDLQSYESTGEKTWSWLERHGGME